jgi:putative NADH-flavin reductase
MKIVIFGASGGTGKALVKQALDAGHRVTAFVRDPARLPLTHDRLAIIAGNVYDKVAVEKAIAGKEVVISALGPAPNSPPDVLCVAARNIVAAMHKLGVRRLIWQTGTGVSDPNDAFSLTCVVKRTALGLLSPGALRASEEAYATVSADGLDWTVVRVARLKDGPKVGGYRVGFVPPGPKAVAREDVAAFMLNQIADTQYVRRAPMIGY